MPSTESALARDAAKVAEVFEERVELALWKLGRYATFRVVGVDGAAPLHRITVARYDDQVFLNPASRDPSDRLTLLDLDYRVRYGQVGNVANIEMRVLKSHTAPGTPLRFPRENYIAHGERVSLRGLLAEAYQLGGYGSFHDRLNSNGVSPSEADALAIEALGLPPASLRADAPALPEQMAAARRVASAVLEPEDRPRARSM